MTTSQAEDIVRQFFKVKKANGGNDPLPVPMSLAEAELLLGESRVSEIEAEVNGQ